MDPEQPTPRAAIAWTARFSVAEDEAITAYAKEHYLSKNQAVRQAVRLMTGLPQPGNDSP